MPPIKSLEDLLQLREAALDKGKTKTGAGMIHISVAMGACGLAVGARQTMEAILDEIKIENLSGVLVTQTGCLGLCEKEPIVQVQIGDQPKIVYGKVSPSVAKRIVKEHVASREIVTAYKIEM